MRILVSTFDCGVRVLTACNTAINSLGTEECGKMPDRTSDP